MFFFSGMRRPDLEDPTSRSAHERLAALEAESKALRREVARLQSKEQPPSGSDPREHHAPAGPPRVRRTEKTFGDRVATFLEVFAFVAGCAVVYLGVQEQGWPWFVGVLLAPLGGGACYLLAVARVQI